LLTTAFGRFFIAIDLRKGRIMTQLVISVKDTPMTTTDIIAEYTGVQHKNIIELVRTYKTDLEDFAPLAFQTHVVDRPQGGGTEKEVALLTEEQATLLITYMRNSKTVRTFKKAIVKAFFAMRKELLARKPAIADKRNSHNGMMVALVEHREDLGKETKSHHFIIENKLCNWSITGKFEPIDESQLAVDDIQLLGFARRLNESMIMLGTPYDERKRQLAIHVERKRNKLIKLLAA
jgi:phage regulator Rha-like protein